MNYNERNPTFSFRLNHVLNSRLTKIAKLEKISTNEMARLVIEKWLNNQLVDKKSDDLQTEKTKLQIEKLKLECQRLQARNEFMKNPRATITMKKSLYVENNTNETIRSPYDESNKRLQCVECGSLFGWKNQDEYYEKAGELQTHLMLKHDRRFNALEKEVIDNLTYEGDST